MRGYSISNDKTMKKIYIYQLYGSHKIDVDVFNSGKNLTHPLAKLHYCAITDDTTDYHSVRTSQL